MMRLIIAGFGLALVLLLALYTPATHGQPLSEEAVGQLIRAALFSYFDPSSTFDISVVNSRVSGDVIQIADLTISGKPVFLRGIRGEFLLRVTDLQVQAGALYEGQAKVQRVGKATIVAKSTSAAMAEGLSRASPSIISPNVRFHAGEFEVTAAMKRDGKLYPAQARGRLVVERGQRVWATITQVKVSGGDIPQGTIQQELLKINPILDLSQWPLDLRIQRLNLHNNVIELLATK